MTTPARQGRERVVLPASAFTARAAQAVIERHRPDWPDLSGLLVLVPDLHCAPDVARALVAAGGGGAALLPRITTLAALAASVDLPLRVTPQSVREVELYEALARRPPFTGSDVWALASELVALFDRLTRARSAIPRDGAEFAAALRAAYRSGRNRALDFEAALVHELWWAQAPQRLGQLPAGAAVSVDAATAYALRLAELARTLDVPVYALALPALDAVDQSFLDACALRVPVLQFEPGCAAGDPPLDRTLELAWAQPARDGDQPVPVPEPLRERALALARECPHSALAARLAISAADSLEQQARAIDVAVRRALIEGCTRIGIVVFDRLVARRARALLERAQVPVQDESGWLLSTTVAAACVGRLLDVSASRGYHRDLLDLLRSPFVFAQLPPHRRWAALACIERTLAEHDLRAGIGEMIVRLGTASGRRGGAGRQTGPALPPPDAGPDEAVATARSMLIAVEQAIAALDGGTRKPLAQWIEALDRALAHLGAGAALAADAAGADLLDLLALRRAELQGQRWRAGLSQWRAWLARTLETANFRPREVRSPVVFTYLAAVPLRRFDLLVLAGADAAHLPAGDPPGSFFNQAVRARLGLSTRLQERARIERDLRLAITAAPRVLLTWQSRLAGEPNLLSPWFARLQALHREAYPGQSLAAGVDLHATAVAAPLLAAAVALPVPAGAPAPAAPAARAPLRISVSGYETLIACPYRFHAEVLLGLRPQDAVSEALEKSDFGELVHAILARFHTEVGELAPLGEETAIARLILMSQSMFDAAVRRNFIDRAWLARWIGSIPAYVAWQLEREAAGWRVDGVEIDRSLPIATPGGRTITLRGRLDRVDRQQAGGAAAGSLAVIDYKAQGVQALRERAQSPSEHVQLPAYALLAGAATAETLFLSIAPGAVTGCASEAEPAAAAEANRVRLATLADRLHEAAALPANGAEAVCAYCEVRGLCRRDHWTAAPAAAAQPQ